MQDNKNTARIYVGLITLVVGLLLNSFKSSLVPDNRMLQQLLPIISIGLILIGIVFIVIGVYKANKSYNDKQSNKKK